MHLPDGDREVIACLKRLTEDAYESVKRAVLPLSFSCDRYSAYETMISTIANTSSFVMMVVCNAPGECAMTVLDHLLACCVAEKEGSDVVDVMRLLVVVYFAFSSAIHVRQCILQAKLSQQRFFLRHSQFLEDASRFLASVLARHTNTTLIAVFTNYLGEMMHSFVRKWKDLYRTTDVLMNNNVFSALNSFTRVMIDGRHCRMCCSSSAFSFSPNATTSLYHGQFSIFSRQPCPLNVMPFSSTKDGQLAFTMRLMPSGSSML